MDLQLFKNRNGVMILICILAIILIYAIDIPKLAYSMTSWQPFGETPVTVKRVQYFIADTPNVIGFIEPDGTSVSCATTVAYIETNAGDTYRCCDTGKAISCAAGEYSTDFPPANEECTKQLQETFGIPATFTDAKDYHLFGKCGNDGGTEFTVVQVNANGGILWRYLNAGNIIVLSSGLRCLLAPLLLLAIIGLVVLTIRSRPKEQIRRF